METIFILKKEVIMKRRHTYFPSCVIEAAKARQQRNAARQVSPPPPEACDPLQAMEVPMTVPETNPQTDFVTQMVIAADGDVRAAFERFVAEHPLEDHFWLVFLWQAVEWVSRNDPSAPGCDPVRPRPAAAKDPVQALSSRLPIETNQ